MAARVPPAAALRHVCVVAAPGVLPDVPAARRVLDRATAARGVTGELVVPASAGGLAAAVERAAALGEVVLLPGRSSDVDSLDLATASVIRVDLDDHPPDRSAAVHRHIRGRGVEGIRYAVDAWASHRAAPAMRHAYGPHPDQHCELRLPPADDDGPVPVAALVHGGYWRDRWESDLMDAMAVDLTERGFATWNVEYRRPGRHGWAATTADVAAAMGALAQVDGALDLARVVTVGHSAGGQLVTRWAADASARPAAALRPALTVSLAGVLDLAAADRSGLGTDAVADALGGRHTELPLVYRRSSPMARVPIGVPIAVVCGRQDDPHLLAMARAFARAATAAGDDVTHLEADGDHFSVIDPAAPIWADVVRLVLARIRP